MSEEELKPCPYCGSKATVQVIPPHTHKLTKWIPDCNGEVIIECKCGCAIMRDTEEEAITHWNTRKPIENIVEQLEEWTFNADVNLGDGTLKNSDLIASKNAIEIVKRGIVSDDDVCEWHKTKNNNAYYKCNTHAEIHDSRVLDWCKCPYCGKKIKVVEQMTIDEIITHQRELEEDFRSYKTTNKESAFKKQCEKQAKECEQIAEWLEELKAYKEKEFDVLKQDGQLLYKQGVIDGYDKAIDDFEKNLIGNSRTEVIDGKITLIVTEKRIKLIAEQLKAGGTDE